MNKQQTREETAAAVAAFQAAGGEIKTAPETTSPVKSAKTRAHKAPLAKDDEKYPMYLNALPTTMRQWAFDTDQDVRQLYQEYRRIGRDALVAKYVSK